MLRGSRKCTRARLLDRLQCTICKVCLNVALVLEALDASGWYFAFFLAAGPYSTVQVFVSLWLARAAALSGVCITAMQYFLHH